MQSSLDNYLLPSEITEKSCFHLYNVIVSVNWLMADTQLLPKTFFWRVLWNVDHVNPRLWDVC